ncbi:MAG: T9SS type A sorting domain-containing protein [Ignavibacteriae bacterium]|nr:T9SS type A sorting domain-containing protein [Ignavibacteriota bacterium]
MRLRTIFSITVILIAVIALSTTSYSQARVGAYGLQLIVKDDATGGDTLYAGFSNATSVSEFCIDADTFEVAPFGVSVNEFENPPLPPDGVFDARFINNRTSAVACLGQGLPNNFHLAKNFSSSFRDTFRVQFQGSAASGGAYPFHFSWNLSGTTYANGSWTMRYTVPDEPTTVVDMVANSSHDITSAEVNRVLIIFDGTVGVREVGEVIPQTFGLNQNYPNPFNPATTIRFDIKNTSETTIAVYDVLGRKIASLVNEQLSPKQYEVTWNGMTDNGIVASSGTYYIRMNAKYTENGVDDEFSSVRKIVLMK